MPLTDAACRAAKPGDRIKKLSDAGGLQLWIQPNGSKLWRVAYRFGGKQKLLAVGAYPTVSLADARTARENAKRVLAKGVDPSAEKRELKAIQAASGHTFRVVAEEYLDKLRSEGRAPATLHKTEWLLAFAYPSLGRRPITEIKPAEVLAVLKQVEARGRHESARRLRSTMGTVFRFAVATARAETDPTVALRGALITPRVKHRPAVTEPRALGGMLRAIADMDGQATTKAALELMALLFPRPGELRASAWQEFDLVARIWTMPAERAKMRRAHRIPLPIQAVAILEKLQHLTGRGKLVFPSVRTVLRPISENTLNAALRRLGYSQDEATAHGFRATASTLLNQSGRWNPDAIERQLAHVDADDVRRAYARGEHWDERVQMIQWWADYLDLLRREASVPQHELA